MKKFIILVLILFIVFIPQISEAEEDKEYKEDDSYDIKVIEKNDDDEIEKEGILKIEYDGMVPCGRCLSVSVKPKEEEDGDKDTINPIYSRDLDEIHNCENSIHFGTTKSEAETYIPCTFCHVFIIFDRVISFVLGSLIPAIALIVIVGAGVTMIVSTGDPDKTKTAKDALKYAVLGIFLAYFSWAIITLIISNFMDWDIEWGGEGIEVQHMCDVNIERPSDMQLPKEE